MTKDEALQAAWTLYNRYPQKRTAIMAKLEDYDITINEYNEHDSTMNATAQINILEKRAEEFEEIPGFSQVEGMSDAKILSIFEDRDNLNSRLEEIGRPPTDAEWYQVGLDAEERIAKLRPFYETKKEEEWGSLEPVLPGPFAPMGSLVGGITELVAGWMDWMPGLASDFGERLHERGAFTSWDPLTGFGAWDIAEFKADPETGQRGFSPELLAMEKELNELYGVSREYQEQMTEGGYREAYGINKGIASLNQEIYDNKLLDPRLLGELQ